VSSPASFIIVINMPFGESQRFWTQNIRRQVPNLRIPA